MICTVLNLHGIDLNLLPVHFLLLEGLLADKALSTEYYRGLSDSTNNSIEQLEALAEMRMVYVLRGEPTAAAATGCCQPR